MPSADLCSEEEIKQLVYVFYAKVREHPTLSPVFNEHVLDWDKHLPKMVDFWSSALRGTARFHGTPMPKHAALPGLTWALFQDWLALFAEITAALPNRNMAERANHLAQRIAQSLWYGWQISRNQGIPVGAA